MKTLLEKIHARFAIVNRGFDQVNLRGSVGAVTYRRVGGETIASQKVPPKQTFKPTWSLMYRRMLWPNLVSLFRLMNVVGWHPSFMGKAPRVSDFNAFMARNVSNPATRVFLEKGYQQSGAAVVAPVVVSEGNLTPIVLAIGENNVMVSNINVGGLSIGASTSVGDLSEAIITNNPEWSNKDQLTLLILRQSINSASGIPEVKAEHARMVLDVNNSTDLLEDIGFLDFISAVDNKLAFAGVITGGATMVHSRDVVGEETQVSTQSLFMNSTILQVYQTLQAFETAADSYGGVRTAQYLTPRSGADEVFPQA